MSRLSWSWSLSLLLLLSGSCSCFRFEPESGGLRGDVFGQAELANVVPRLGRRSASPFDASRFRFRFNQFRPSSTEVAGINRLPAFRFTSEDDLEGGRRNFFLIKKKGIDNNSDNFNKWLTNQPVDVIAHNPQLAKLLEVEEAKLAEQQKEWLMLQMLEKKRLDKLLSSKAQTSNDNAV